MARTPRAPRVSGEFVSDPTGILRRALEASGLGERATAFLAIALDRAGLAGPPSEPANLWIFCIDHVVPLVDERAGRHAAASAHIRLAGAITALDTIESARARERR